jgi:hypothetical protein
MRMTVLRHRALEASFAMSREGAMRQDVEALLKWALYANVQADAPVQLAERVLARHGEGMSERQRRRLGLVLERAQQTRASAQALVVLVERLLMSVDTTDAGLE